MTISEREAWAPISAIDPELWTAMEGERRRQHDKIELIASENYTIGAVMEAQGSLADQQVRRGAARQALLRRLRVRRRRRALAIERALALFPGAEHVNVQPTRVPRRTWPRTSAALSRATASSG